MLPDAVDILVNAEVVPMLAPAASGESIESDLVGFKLAKAVDLGT